MKQPTREEITKNIKMVIGPGDYLFCEDDIQELVKKYANDAYI